MDLVLTSTNYTEVKNNPLNPSNSMVRYKFMEVLVRIAADKYVRRKKTKGIVEALAQVLDTVIPVYREYDTEEWRWSRYLCEDVDLVLKQYKPILDYVYNRFSGRKAKPHQKPYMSKEEWSDVCSFSNLINDQFPARETDLVYSLAMSIHIDELTQSKHMEMTFVEFLEAFARACEKACLNHSDDQPLSVKIRNAIPALCKLCPKCLYEGLIESN